MIDLLRNIDLISAQLVGKDENGKLVKINLNHEDLKKIEWFIVNSPLKIEDLKVKVWIYDKNVEMWTYDKEKKEYVYVEI